MREIDHDGPYPCTVCGAVVIEPGRGRWCRECQDARKRLTQRSRRTRERGQPPRKYHCGYCNEIGHNIVSCPVKEYLGRVLK